MRILFLHRCKFVSCILVPVNSCPVYYSISGKFVSYILFPENSCPVSYFLKTLVL